MNCESLFARVQLSCEAVADKNKSAVIQSPAPSYAPNDQQIQVNTYITTFDDHDDDDDDGDKGNE